MENPVAVEELADPRVEQPQDEVDPARPEEDLVSLIMQATSLPSNVETQFLAMSSQMPIKSYERPALLQNVLPTLLDRAVSNLAVFIDLFIRTINECNFIEIECELRR